MEIIELNSQNELLSKSGHDNPRTKYCSKTSTNQSSAHALTKCIKTISPQKQSHEITQSEMQLI